ncbi:MAG: substrate-binding domain-containing protein [Chthoniobacterales bacterium]
MRKRSRIYVILIPHARYSREVYLGIMDYFSKITRRFEIVVVYDPLYIDRKQPCAGIIAMASTKAWQKKIKASRVPAVNVSSYLEYPLLPTVVSDTALGAKMVANHLIECRFHHFGFYGCKESYNNRVMNRAFRETVTTAGFSCVQRLDARNKPGHALDPAGQDGLEKWIAALPKPIGIFAGSDYDAWAISNACDTLDINVGREVGIVGYTNDEFFCQACHPQLSSVESRPDRIGSAAAELLFRLIRGRKAPKKIQFVPPAGVIRRGSSDVLVAEDTHVASAIQFIRENIGKPLGILQVFNRIPLSRRTLERRFHDCLGYTVLETIQILKIERAKHLLISSSASIEEIANQCGFPNASYMTRLFRKNVGIPSREYRSHFRCKPR